MTLIIRVYKNILFLNCFKVCLFDSLACVCVYGYVCVYTCVCGRQGEPSRPNILSDFDYVHSNESHAHPHLQAAQDLMYCLCRLKQQHNFGPMDYGSLQRELTLKAPLWRKMLPTESHEDSSITVVYRIDNVTKWNQQQAIVCACLWICM